MHNPTTTYISDTIIAGNGLVDLVNAMEGVVHETVLQEAYVAIGACLDFLMLYPISAFSTEEISAIDNMREALARTNS